MNYYGAREKQDHSGWHFTCRNDDHIWPVGYCGEHGPHTTKDEAQDCYRKYLLDKKLRLDGEYADTYHKCAVCGELTNKFAELSMETFHLCDKHRNREEIEKLFGSVGEIISSY